jgi:uncharacterized Zn-binding protein involved in type VI secretion
MAFRSVCRQGDKTSHGGTILGGYSTISIDGIPAAGVGHKGFCPQCKTEFVIVAGAVNVMWLGKNVAIEGMLTSCGAALIASQSATKIDVVPGPSASKGAKTAAVAAALTTASAAQSMPKFDEQIRFFWPDRKIVAETRYKLTLADGSVLSGTTDAAGKTQRIETETEQAITCAEFFPEQIFCCDHHADQLCAIGGQAPNPDAFSILMPLRGVQTNPNDIGHSITVQTIVPKTTRGLTPGEIEMATLVFKDAIDYGVVKVHQGGLFGLPTAKNTAMTPNGEIFFPEQAYQVDFSVAENKDKIWFIHELVHVWQYQLGYGVKWHALDLAIRGGYGSNATAYDYDLDGVDAGKTLAEFNMEQQGELISHYFDALFLDQTGRPKQHARALQNLTKISAALGSFRRNPKDASLLPKTSGISSNQHR